MSLDALKAQARKSAFARRREAFEAKGAGQAAVLSGLLAGYRGVCVAGYMPINTEISPLAAMAECCAHGPVCVPVIVAPAQPLTFAQWDPDCAMVEGAFKALIPAQVTPVVPEVVIVPLVAFDVQGGRLGYGGGFYDRTLEGLRAARPVLAVGFAFEAQVASDLPLEATDQPLDIIVTERRIIEISNP